MIIRNLIMFLLWPLVVYAGYASEPTLIKPYQMGTFNQDVENVYRLPDSHSKRILDRIKADSGYFLNRPYVLGSTGEGEHAPFDKNPLYRTDQFDCLTYVETVLALVKSNGLDEFLRKLPAIRYHAAPPAFLYRNHFTEADWNPHNQCAGYIKDVTRILFPHHYQVAAITLDKPAWFRHLPASALKLFSKPIPQQTQQLLTQLRDLSKKTQAVKVQLAYVPLSALFDKKGQPVLDLFDRIPDGSIIEIVRPNWDLRKLIGTRLLISHLGFGLRIHGVLMYREASSLDGKVEDIPLIDYLRGYLQHSTVQGIHIEQVI